MPVEIWFAYNNGEETLQLPVNPSELKVSAGSANETASVQRLGQITVMQDPVLRTYELSSHFPKHYGPYCAYKDIPSPRRCIDRLETWKNSGHPVQFIVITPEKDKELTVPVTIESLSYREIAGDVGSLYYELSLREYKYVKPRVVETKQENGRTVAEVSGKGQRPSQAVRPKTVTVKPGDTLWAIERRVGVPYAKIAAANGIAPPYTIRPDQVLVIP
jgi:nucleoid-associated protein YgaU